MGTGSVNAHCSFSPLAFVQAQFPYFSAEKMVNVVITVPVVSPEMSVNDKRVCIIVNIRIIAANIVPVYIRHGAYDPPNLVYTDIRVRYSKPLFVAGEIILEHPENHPQSVRPWFITPLYQFPKCLKIKKRFIHLQSGHIKMAAVVPSGHYKMGRGERAQKRRRHFIHLFLGLLLFLLLLLLLFLLLCRSISFDIGRSCVWISGRDPLQVALPCFLHVRHKRGKRHTFNG